MTFREALEQVAHEFDMHKKLRNESQHIREALLNFGAFLIMKDGGRHTLDSFMFNHKHHQDELQHNLRRATHEVFQCVAALHRHGIVHRVSGLRVRCICICICVYVFMTWVNVETRVRDAM